MLTVDIAIAIVCFTNNAKQKGGTEMGKKTETIRLPLETLDHLKKISELARVPVDTVVAVILAADIVRLKSAPK